MKLLPTFFFLLFYCGFTHLSHSATTPTDMEISNTSISENQPVSTLVGLLSATDADNDISSYSLVSGSGDSDNGLFSIVNGNELVTSSILNYETDSQLNIRIQVIDDLGNTYEEAFLINVTDENDAPSDLSITNRKIDEGLKIDEVVSSTNFTDEDASETVTFSLVEGTGDTNNDYFYFDNSNILRLAKLIDYETTQNLSIRVQVEDSQGATLVKTHSFKILDNVSNVVSEITSDIQAAGSTQIFDIAEDGSGNLYLAGRAYGDTKIESTSIDKGGFLIKYDASGTLVYARNISDNENSEVLSVEVDASNNLYLYVRIADCNGDENTNCLITVFGSEFEISGTFSYPDFIFKVSENFNIQWYEQITNLNGFGRSVSPKIALDDSFLYLATDFESGQTTFYNGTANDTFSETVGDPESLLLYKWSLDGTRLWGKVYSTTGVGLVRVNQLAVSNGEMILANSEATYSAILRKYDANGDAVFTKRFERNGSAYFGQALTVAANGDIYFAGDMYNTNSQVVLTTETGDYPASASGASFLLKYNSTGLEQFVEIYKNTTNTTTTNRPIIQEIITNGTSVFLATKLSQSEVLINGNTLSGLNKSLLFEVNTSGAYIGHYSPGGTAITDFNDIHIDPSDNIHLVGKFRNGTLSFGADTDEAFQGTSSIDAVGFWGRVDNTLTAIGADFAGSAGSSLVWKDAEKGSNGQVYALGEMRGEVNIGATSVTSSSQDLIIAEISPDNTIASYFRFENIGTDETALQLDTYTYEDPLTQETKRGFFILGGGPSGQAASFNGVSFTPSNGHYLVSLNEAYAGVWGETFDSPSKPQLVVDSDHAPTIGGTFSGTITLEAQTLTGGGGQDIYLSKYNNAGTHQWNRMIGGTGDETLLASIAVGTSIYLNVDILNSTFSNFAFNYTANSGVNERYLLEVDPNGLGLLSLQLEPADPGTNKSAFISQLNPATLLCENRYDGWTVFTTYDLVSRTKGSSYWYGTGEKASEVFQFSNDQEQELIGNFKSLSNSVNVLNNSFDVIQNIATVQGRPLLIDSISKSKFKVLSENGIKEFILNEAPESISLSSNTIDENSPEGTFIAKIGVTDNDQDTGFSFSQTNSAFSLSNDSLLVSSNAALDFETTSSYETSITATDTLSGSVSRSFTISLNDVNEAPTEIVVEDAVNRIIGELSPEGTTAVGFSTTDVDAGDDHSYTLVSGAGDQDNSLFYIDGDTLRVNGPLDYESRANTSGADSSVAIGNTPPSSSYYVRVRSTDSRGDSVELPIAVLVKNEAEAPTLLYIEKQFSGGTIGSSDTINQIIENSTPNLTIVTVDPDFGSSTSDYTYELVAGEGDHDNSRFSISSRFLVVDSAFNYEIADTARIRMKVTDSGVSPAQTYEQAIILQVLDRDDPPSGLLFNGMELNQDTLEIAENSGLLSLGKLEVLDEDENDIYTFNVQVHNDYGMPAVSDEDTLQLLESFDYENLANKVFSLSISYLKEGQFTGDGLIYIRGINVNEAPSISQVLTTSGGPIDDFLLEENQKGARIYRVYVSDPDFETDFAYDFVPGEGDDHNGYFTTRNNPGEITLKLDSSFNYEEIQEASFRLRVSDSSGLSVDTVLTVPIADRNDAPYDLFLDFSSFAEDIDSGSVVGNFVALDEDEGDSIFSYRFYNNVDSAIDNSLFTISNNQLVATSTFNYEEDSTYYIIVRATDDGGAFSPNIPVKLSLTDVNESPTGIAIDNLEIMENNEAGAIIGNLEVTDEDFNDSFSYSVSTEDLSISANQLVAAVVLDHENRTELPFDITVIDKGDNQYTVSYVLIITNDPTDDAEQGVLSVTVQKLELYPNPVEDVIRFNNKIDGNYFIHDNSGRLYQRGILAKSIPLEFDEKGVFLLSIIEKNGKKQFFRIIIE